MEENKMTYIDMVTMQFATAWLAVFSVVIYLCRDYIVKDFEDEEA